MSQFQAQPLWQIELEAWGLDCQVVVAESGMLQLDIDSTELPLAFFGQIETLSNQWYTQVSWSQWSSRHGNIHVTVIVAPDLTIPERIALQLMGGSDPYREKSALMCHWNGSPHPILLFKPNPKRLTATAGRG